MEVSQVDFLRAVVAEKLSTAAQEILAAVESTVAGYEEEAAGLRRELDRQRSLLEVLLQLQLPVKAEPADDQFPVCAPAAAGGGSPEEEVQHKPEPSVEDCGGFGLVCHSEVQMEEPKTDEQQQQTAGPDNEAAESSPQLSTPTVQSDRRTTGRPRTSESLDNIDLRIYILEDSQTEVVSPSLFQKCLLQRFRCPRGLEEKDFLVLLRSSFPQLANQKPFDVLTADKFKRLQPLRVHTLTPEEIYSSSQHSALYIRLKAQEELKSTEEEFHPPQRNDADSQSTSDPTSLSTPTVQSDRRMTCRPHPHVSASMDDINLRIYILEDSQTEMISPALFQKCPLQRLRCPRGLEEKDFLVLLRSTFPQLADQKPFDVLTADRFKRLQPLTVHTLTPEEIYRSSRYSALYIRLKPPENVREKDAAANLSPSADGTGLCTRVQSDRTKPGITEPQDYVDLCICILEDSQTNVILPNMFQKCPVMQLMCPPGLQQEDFLDLLKSTFPQLDDQKPFDVFITDGNNELKPLRVETLTPEEIHRTNGHSVLYIRLKEQEGSVEEFRDPSTFTDGTTLNISCSSAPRREDAGTEEDDEVCGPSKLRFLSESEDDESGESSHDGKPDQRKRHLSESEVEVMRKKVEPSGVQMTEKSEAPLSCKVCRALQEKMSMLNGRAFSHVDDPERFCGVCGERSESTEALMSHLQHHQKTHSCSTNAKPVLSVDAHNEQAGKKPYECQTCHKKFTRISWLTKHERTHRVDQPKKCDICLKTFFSQTELNQHILDHIQEKPRVCDVCGKSLRNLRLLSQHMWFHSASKKTFDCEICSRKFARKQNLKNHIRNHCR